MGEGRSRVVKGCQNYCTFLLGWVPNWLSKATEEVKKIKLKEREIPLT